MDRMVLKCDEYGIINDIVLNDLSIPESELKGRNFTSLLSETEISDFLRFIKEVNSKSITGDYRFSLKKWSNKKLKLVDFKIGDSVTLIAYPEDGNIEGII